VTTPADSGDGRVSAFEEAALIEHDLTPAVHSLAQMRDLDRLAAGPKAVRYHLKSIPDGTPGTRASGRKS